MGSIINSLGLNATSNYHQDTPGGAAYTNAMGQAQNQASGMFGQQEGLAGQQQSFIDQLRQQSSGQGPSVAQGLLQQQTQQNMAGNASAIASQRGMNPALQAQMLLNQNAAQQQTAAGADRSPCLCCS